jgi:hypothetical protein
VRGGVGWCAGVESVLVAVVAVVAVCGAMMDEVGERSGGAVGSGVYVPWQWCQVQVRRPDALPACVQRPWMS